MKVRFSESATADLRDILSYLTDINPTAAARVADAIEATTMRISEFPDSAQRTDQPGLRMAPAGRFPYLIFTPKPLTRFGSSVFCTERGCGLGNKRANEALKVAS